MKREARRPARWLCAAARPTLGFVVVLWSSCYAPPDDARPLLALNELRAFRLDESFVPFGAEIGNDTAVIAWDRRDSRILVLSTDWRSSHVLQIRLRDPADTIVAASRVGSDVLEIATMSGISRYPTTEHRVEVLHSFESMRVVAADPGGNGWNLVAVQNSALGPGDVVFASWREDEWQVGRLPFTPAAVTAIPPSLSETHEAALIVRERRAPHAAVIVDASGGIRRWPAFDLAMTSGGEEDGLLHLTGIHRIGDYLLQVMADLKSDTRILAVSESDGRVLRSRVLDVPFGILGASEDGGLALGLRGEPPSRELVLYSIAVTPR